MTRRFLALAFVLILLVPLVSTLSTASAQASGSPLVSLTSQSILNGAGAVVVNETISFANNGTSAEQIPTVHLGLPDRVADHSPGFVIDSVDPYSEVSSDNGSVTTFTISTSSATLAAGARSTVSLKGFVTGLLSLTPGVSVNISALTLLSPSLDQKVVTLNQDVIVPSSGAITPIPAGFIAAPTALGETYAATISDVTPTISVENFTFSDSDQGVWQPVQVYSVIRNIVATSNGVPQVQDTVSLRNLASYSITDLPVKLLAGTLTNVTILPSSTVPTINPTPVGLTNGELNIAQPPFSSEIAAGGNFTFTMAYALPKADIQTSGNTVSVTIPYVLPIQTVVRNYTVSLALPDGMHPSGSSKVVTSNATSLISTSLGLKYTISPGWGADQAVPAAALIFAACFILLSFGGVQMAGKKKVEEEEEEEALGDRLSDLTKALEEKISLFQAFQDDVAKKSQGTVTRNDLSKIKNELDALKARATNRLNAVRQAAETQRYQDLLNQLQEAERNEDRAAKDMINLYDQYHSKRMREETFRRLYPNYKKRLDSATNHLSDLINLAQREGKQA